MEDNNSMEISNSDIKKLIYTIRGKQVILDSDVAMLYKTETRVINQTVKRNINRFPERFCFQLTEKEYENLKSQIVISSFKKENSYGGRRKIPLVFTEQGIAMLAGLLKSNVAVITSINIMDAFVEMRRFLYFNGQIFERLTNVEYKLLEQNKKIKEHDKNFEIIFNELQNSKKEEFKEKIFYEGQIYDAYNLIIKIIKMAQSKITIIDNYINQSILEMLTQKNNDVEVVLLTSSNCPITKLEIEKFNRQYPIIKLAKTNTFHDRFIVIDNSKIYHCGASLKDAGKKCFAINKIEDENFLKTIAK